MSEHKHQAAVVKWWDLKYPKIKNALFSIPNGTVLAGNSKMRGIQMNKLKAEGLRPGVSDLFLMVPNKGFNGLYIEMKDQGKTKSSVSEKQSEFMALAKRLGYEAKWCAGSENAIRTIQEYMWGHDEQQIQE